MKYKKNKNRNSNNSDNGKSVSPGVESLFQRRAGAGSRWVHVQSSWATLTGLAVSEDASVVAVERIVEDVLTHRREHRLLRGKRRALAVQGVEAVVEGEGLGLLATVKGRKERVVR